MNMQNTVAYIRFFYVIDLLSRLLGKYKAVSCLLSPSLREGFAVHDIRGSYFRFKPEHYGIDDFRQSRITH